MMMMVHMIQTYKVYDDQIKSLLIIILCTCLELLEIKANKKGFCVIDPFNEQLIVIIGKSHDRPDIL